MVSQSPLPFRFLGLEGIFISCADVFSFRLFGVPPFPPAGIARKFYRFFPPFPSVVS